MNPTLRVPKPEWRPPVWLRALTGLLILACLVLAASLLLRRAPEERRPPAPPPAPPGGLPEPPRAAPARTSGGYRTELARLLAAEDFTRADEWLRAARAEPRPGLDAAAVASLEEFVQDIRTAEDGIQEAFRQKLGADVDLNREGQTYTLRLKEMTNDTVRADLITGTGAERRARPIVLRVSELEPLERSRWLGEPDTPAAAALRCILHLQAGDYAAAAALAAKCGPLADGFAELAEERASGRTP